MGEPTAGCRTVCSAAMSCGGAGCAICCGIGCGAWPQPPGAGWAGAPQAACGSGAGSGPSGAMRSHSGRSPSLMSEPAENRGGCWPCAPGPNASDGDCGPPKGLGAPAPNGAPNGAPFMPPGCGCDQPAEGVTGAPHRGQVGVFGVRGCPQRWQLITKRLFRAVHVASLPGRGARMRVLKADDARVCLKSRRRTLRLRR